MKKKVYSLFFLIFFISYNASAETFLSLKKNKVSENGINLKNSSNQKNKKLTQKQKQLEIEINHRKSGYYKQSLKFVSGGLYITS